MRIGVTFKAALIGSLACLLVAGSLPTLTSRVSRDDRRDVAENAGGPIQTADNAGGSVQTA